MRANLDFGTQSSLLEIGSEQVILHLEHDLKAAEKKYLGVEEIGTPLKDFTLKIDAVPASNESLEEELVFFYLIKCQ